MGTNNTRQAAWVALGSLFSFAVSVVSPMILSRFFEKADYGTYKQVMYVYSTLLIVFTLGLPRAYAYFLPKYPIEQARGIIRKITAIFLAMGALFSLTLFFGAPLFADWLKNPDLDRAIRIFAPVPLFLLPVMGLDGILSTYRKTQYLALYTICTRIFTVACTILPVICFGGGYIEAIVGFDIASVLTCLLAVILMNRPLRGVSHLPTEVRYSHIFKFAMPLLYAALWAMVIKSATQFFVSRYYGSAVFAELSNGFIDIPFVAMIISSVSVVILPLFSRMDKGDGFSAEALSLWQATLQKTSKLIFPMLIYGAFMAQIIMVCMYSGRYAGSGVYFLIKNIGGLFYIIPFTPILLALGKTKTYARLTMLTALLTVLSEFVAVRLNAGPVVVALASEICWVLYIILLFCSIAKYSTMKLYQLLPMACLGKLLAASFVSAAAAWCVVSLLSSLNEWILLGLSAVVFIVVYWALSKLFRITYKDIVSSLLPKLAKSKLMKLVP